MEEENLYGTWKEFEDYLSMLKEETGDPQLSNKVSTVNESIDEDFKDCMEKLGKNRLENKEVLRTLYRGKMKRELSHLKKYLKDINKDFEKKDMTVSSYNIASTIGNLMDNLERI
jgi:hypothetical protein